MARGKTEFGFYGGTLGGFVMPDIDTSHAVDGRDEPGKAHVALSSDGQNIFVLKGRRGQKRDGGAR